MSAENDGDIRALEAKITASIEYNRQAYSEAKERIQRTEKMIDNFGDDMKEYRRMFAELGRMMSEAVGRLERVAESNENTKQIISGFRNNITELYNQNRTLKDDVFQITGKISDTIDDRQGRKFSSFDEAIAEHRQMIYDLKERQSADEGAAKGKEAYIAIVIGVLATIASAVGIILGV